MKCAVLFNLMRCEQKTTVVVPIKPEYRQQASLRESSQQQIKRRKIVWKLTKNDMICANGAIFTV